jgi:hypothetical protein
MVVFFLDAVGDHFREEDKNEVDSTRDAEELWREKAPQ